MRVPRPRNWGRTVVSGVLGWLDVLGERKLCPTAGVNGVRWPEVGVLAVALPCGPPDIAARVAQGVDTAEQERCIQLQYPIAMGYGTLGLNLAENIGG